MSTYHYWLLRWPQFMWFVHPIILHVIYTTATPLYQKIFIPRNFSRDSWELNKPFSWSQLVSIPAVTVELLSLCQVFCRDLVWDTAPCSKSWDYSYKGEGSWQMFHKSMSPFLKADLIPRVPRNTAGQFACGVTVQGHSFPLRVSHSLRSITSQAVPVLWA